jgi:dolichyl-phosphate beta-glucosyltransferase
LAAGAEIRMTAKPALSVVVPVYNGAQVMAKSLPAALETLDRSGIPYEMIAVDDGSSDSTAEVARRHPQIRLLRYSPNRGKGCALRRGFAQARGEYQFFTDADFPYGAQAILDALPHLRRDCDLVIGDRAQAASRCDAPVPWIRQALSRVCAWAVGATDLLPPDQIRDTQCGLKGMTQAAAQEIMPRLTINGFAHDIELLHVATHWGLRIRRIPVVLLENETSTVRLLRDAWNSAWDILRISANHARGRYDRRRAP